MSLSVFMSAFIFALVPPSPSGSTHVRDHGAFPDDGVNDTMAIKDAIVYAKANNLATINFDAGTYNLAESDNDYHVIIVSATNLTLNGAVSTEGYPLTRLVRSLPLANDPNPPFLLYAQDSRNLTIKNMVLVNDPEPCTAGVVVSSGSGEVVVDIFDGLPIFDNMKCLSANAWDPVSGELLPVPCLTYGISPAMWRMVEGGNGRRVQISGIAFDEHVVAGDYISWHFSALGGKSQTMFLSCEGLTLDNILTTSSTRAAFVFGDIHDLTLQNMEFRPEGNQLSVGSRDGLFISRCTGDIVVKDSTISRVRWDGLTIFTMEGLIDEVESDTIVNFISPHQQGLNPGDLVTFWNAAEQQERTIATWAYNGYDSSGYHYSITLTTPKPAFADVGVYLSPHSWIPDSITVTNLTMSKIAGAAIIIQNMHATIDDCTFENMMYSAVELGTTADEYCPAQDIVVNNCRFIESGWEEKPYRKSGLISVGTGKAEIFGARNKGIVVSNNQFKNVLDPTYNMALEIRDAQDILVTNNVFYNVKDSVEIESSTTSDVTQRENAIIVDNDGNSISYQELSGTWIDSSLVGYDGSLTRYSATPSATTRWTPDLPKTGNYEVYVYKVVHSSSDSNASITVHHDAGDTVGYLDYSTGTSGWVSLGTFSFTAGTSGYVENTQQNGYSRADAVRFIQR